MKRTIKTILSLFLIIILGGFLHGGSAFAVWYSDYRFWSQNQSGYSDRTQYAMIDYGCCVVAQAKMLYGMGVDRSVNFNPDTYLDWEVANGFVSSHSHIEQLNFYGPVEYASQLGKVVTYIGENWDTSDGQIWSNINAGYWTIVQFVEGEWNHFVLIDNDTSLSTGQLYFFESTYNYTYDHSLTLSGYHDGSRYRVFTYQYNELPVINRAVITNKSSSGYDVTVTATCASGLKEIGCYTWHSAMSLDDAKKLYAVPINGTATFHVNYSTFGNPQNVQYYTNVEAFNTQGKGVIKPAVEVVEDLGNDFYATIKQDSSGGYLQCSGSKIVTGLLPESASDTKNAVWHFRKQLDGDYIGSYEISSEGNGGCIDIESYGVADGNGINLLEGVGNLAQRFYICRDRQKGYDRYFFNSVLAMSSLDVQGEYTDLGGTIQLWTTNYTDAQMFLIQSPDWTIEYDANGGAGAPASQTKHYRTPVSIPTTVPSRAYYSFLGWAERATASVAAYAPGDTYSQEGNKTLYAVWERIEADILELPADLKLIGDEAFLQTDADIIVVPESVTQIGENAFGDVVLYGHVGSAAESYADTNGLMFVPLDDES